MSEQEAEDYRSALTNLARAILHDAHDATEVVDEAMRKVLADTESEVPLRVRLYRTVRSLCANIRRRNIRQTRRLIYLDDVPEDTPASKGLDPYAEVDEIRDLEKAISSLSTKDQALIHGYYYDGKTYAELGKDFGVTKQRIEQLMKRALRQLEGLLDDSH